MGDATAVVAYKGFNRDFTCRGFQYEVGKTYELDGEVKVCESGFHACEHPLEVFRYYSPGRSRFAEVTLSGDMSRDSEGSKIAASRITIVAELQLHELIERGVKRVFDRAKPSQKAATGPFGVASAAGPYGAASATGDCGAATAAAPHGAASATGEQGAASTTGPFGVASATGEQGAAIATGHCGAALATGPHGAASASGHGGAASATGYYGAATAEGNNGAASTTGDYGAASATGPFGAAIATGDCGRATALGYCGAAIATGRNNQASGEIGCALFLVERAEDGEIIHVWAGIVGRDGIKPNTFYTLRDGRPVEVED